MLYRRGRSVPRRRTESWSATGTTRRPTSSRVWRARQGWPTCGSTQMALVCSMPASTNDTHLCRAGYGTSPVLKALASARALQRWHIGYNNYYVTITNMSEQAPRRELCNGAVAQARRASMHTPAHLSSGGNKSRNGNNSRNARDCGSRCSSSLATCLLQQGLIFVAKDMLLTMRSNENHNSRHSSSYFHSSIYFLCWRWPSADFKIPLYSHSLTRRYFVQWLRSDWPGQQL